jgi:hypothetical protein
MNFQLKKSRISHLLIPITASIVLVFIVNKTHAESLKIGEIYSSLDRKQVIEVVSENELEMKKKEDIYLVNYNFKDGKLRIIYTEHGTKKVAYYEIVTEGLRDRNGVILFSKTARLKAKAKELKALESTIYYDKKMGLEWLAGPDKATNWYAAQKWVLSLYDFAGGGWRMPTLEELKTLRQKGEKCNIKPFLITTGCWVWSGETKGSSLAWGYDYHYTHGTTVLSGGTGDFTGGSGPVTLNRDESTDDTRGFAVHFRK